MRILLFIFLLLNLSAFSQLTISGTVTTKSGETLPGVNIYILGTFDGGTSNGDGSFSFQTDKGDSLILVASAIGFTQLEIPLSGKFIDLRITMYEKVNELSAVSITAGSIDVSDKAKSMVMKPLDIVTTAGSIGEITGALNTLPGTATVANDGRLFVRGGDASETAIFFDGMRVGNAYGTSTAGVPTRNRFNPNLFKGTFFSTGGYSAEFGGALSSVLALETVDKPARNQTDIGIMSVGASAASTIVGEKQSLSAEVQYINLAPYQDIVKQNFDWEAAPEVLQGQVVYRHTLGKDGMIKGFVQGSNSNMIIWQKQAGSDDRGTRIGIKNNFGFGNASYKKPISDKWLAEGGFSASLNADQFDIDSATYKQDNNLFHIKQKITHYFSDAFKLKFGTELFLQKYTETDAVINASRSINETKSASFAEAEWYASTKLTMRAGLRHVYSSLNAKSRIEPRFAAAFRPYKNGTLSLATGIFSQSQNPDVLIGSPQIDFSVARHYQLSFQHDVDGKIFRAEAYYKDYDGLATVSGNGYNASGSGFAKGFDMFFRDRNSIKNIDYWVTYSFVRSRRQYANFATQVQPGFAPEHNLSVVAKYWIAKWKSLPGATFSMNSGFTYDNPNLPGEMESITPRYASLSVNWSYLYRPNLIIHLACNNVLGRENVFGYRYSNAPSDDGTFQSMQVGQPAARFLFVGVFWTISSDKKANQLNNL